MAKKWELTEASFRFQNGCTDALVKFEGKSVSVVTNDMEYTYPNEDRTWWACKGHALEVLKLAETGQRNKVSKRLGKLSKGR